MEVHSYPENLDVLRLCSILADELKHAGGMEPDFVPGSIKEEMLAQMPDLSPFKLLAERACRAQGLPWKGP